MSEPIDIRLIEGRQRAEVMRRLAAGEVTPEELQREAGGAWQARCRARPRFRSRIRRPRQSIRARALFSPGVTSRKIFGLKKRILFNKISHKWALSSVEEQFVYTKIGLGGLNFRYGHRSGQKPLKSSPPCIL